MISKNHIYLLVSFASPFLLLNIILSSLFQSFPYLSILRLTPYFSPHFFFLPSLSFTPCPVINITGCSRTQKFCRSMVSSWILVPLFYGEIRFMKPRKRPERAYNCSSGCLDLETRNLFVNSKGNSLYIIQKKGSYLQHVFYVISNVPISSVECWLAWCWLINEKKKSSLRENMTKIQRKSSAILCREFVQHWILSNDKNNINIISK